MCPKSQGSCEVALVPDLKRWIVKVLKKVRHGGISDSETIRQIKSLTKQLEAERRDEAVATKAILAEHYADQYFVNPYSGTVYNVTQRYPTRMGDLMGAIWDFLDNPLAEPLILLSDGLSGATGLAYTTYDAWGKPVYGMPIRAYQESEQERFMEAMERDPYGAPYAKFVDPRWGEPGYKGVKKGRYMIDVPAGMVEDLDCLGGTGYALYRMDSVLGGHWWAAHYSIPYYDQKGKVRMALGRQQWEAEEQYLGLMKAGVAKAPYYGQVEPADFGFDMATKMG